MIFFLIIILTYSGIFYILMPSEKIIRLTKYVSPQYCRTTPWLGRNDIGYGYLRHHRPDCNPFRPARHSLYSSAAFLAHLSWVYCALPKVYSPVCITPARFGRHRSSVEQLCLPIGISCFRLTEKPLLVSPQPFTTLNHL